MKFSKMIVTVSAFAAGWSFWGDGGVGQRPATIAAAEIDNYAEALDHLTREFLVLLEKDKLLVVWCFDESQSMRDDQPEIRERIGRVYEELSLARKARGNAVVTSVVSYGETFRVHTRTPTAKKKEIQSAIEKVPVDKSGKERMCTALHRAITVHHMQSKHEKRKTVLILVTDESGDRKDNIEHLESVVKLARDAECRIYVLGREAIFGLPYAHLRWEHPETKRRHWLKIDRGPETAFVQHLQTSGFERRLDALSSGFGPYEQMRLARETGGIFFALPSVEISLVQANRRRYELEAMRPYRPDLRSRLEILADRDESPLRQVLWKLICDLNPNDEKLAKLVTLKTEFKDADQMVVALKPTETYLRYLQSAVESLESVKVHRDEESSRRWQANYDLTIAQLITFQARIHEYRAQLRSFIKKPHTAPPTRHPNLTLSSWKIYPQKQTIDEDKSRPLFEKAETLLEATVKEHPGTPWAAQAELELRRGLGMRIVPKYRPPTNDLPNETPPPMF